jgi:fibronectin-binding autotransporter adhesin
MDRSQHKRILPTTAILQSEIKMKNYLQKSIYQRSSIMTHTAGFQFAGKVLFTLLALVLVTSLVTAQDLILNGNTTNNGTINVNRNVVNNTAGTVSVGGTGIVQLTGNGGANTHSIQGGTGINFYRLDMRGNRITTLNTATAVTDRLRVGYASNTYTAGTTGFSIGTQTLTIGNTSSYDASSTAALMLTGGTVAYNSGVAQAILNNATGVTYGTLALSGAGAKSVVVGGTVKATSLSQTGGQLSVAENIDVTGTGSFADIGAISAAKRLRLTAAATSGAITAMSNSGTGTFENAANISVTIATLSANAGTIQNSGTGSIAFTNAAASNGTITNTSTGTIDFTNDLTGTGIINQTVAGTIKVGGAFTQNTYTLSNGTVLYYSNTAGQNIVGATYNNLTLNNGTKTLANTATVNGNLTLDASSALNMNNNNMSLAGNLVLGSNITTGLSGVLTMTSTTASNVSGAGEVVGAVRRNHNFTTGSNYMFNRTDVYLGTATKAASDITLRMSTATDPASPLASANYVKRNYAITATTAGNLESIRLYYAAGELQGSLITDDSKIGLRAFSGGTWTKVTNPGQVRTSGGGNTYMTYSGLSNALPASGELGMFRTNYVTSANGANISLAAGWDENALPNNTDDAVINHTGVVTGNVAVNVATLAIASGKALSTDGTGVLTVATSSQVDGTLNVTSTNANIAAVTVGSAGVITVASGKTLTGTSYTNNSSSPSTFTGNVSLSSLANNGTGALSFNGGASSISGAVTNLAGSAITVGGTLNMMTSSALSLTSAGNITVNGATGILNIGAAGTASNLTMSGTSVLTLGNATSQLNIFGNLEIGATATLDNSGQITVGE